MLSRWGIIGVDEINANLACTSELRVYDSVGNVSGTVKGEIRMEIQNPFYYNNTVLLQSGLFSVLELSIGCLKAQRRF